MAKGSDKGRPHKLTSQVSPAALISAREIKSTQGVQPGDSGGLTSRLSLGRIRNGELFPIHNCTQKCRSFYKAHCHPTPSFSGVPGSNCDSLHPRPIASYASPQGLPKGVPCSRSCRSPGPNATQPVFIRPGPPVRVRHTHSKTSPTSTLGSPRRFQLLNVSSSLKTRTKCSLFLGIGVKIHQRPW